MAKVTGVVEVVMNNKFDDTKIAMKVDGDDRWFNQKKEWLDVVPNRGDTVEFDDGGAKYIKFLKVVDSGGGAPAGKAPAKKGGFVNNTLGIELGHAANNAVSLAVARGTLDLDSVKELTVEFYDMMKELRAGYEGKKVEAKPVKKESKPAVDVDVEDDPF